MERRCTTYLLQYRIQWQQKARNLKSAGRALSRTGHGGQGGEAKAIQKL